MAVVLALLVRLLIHVGYQGHDDRTYIAYGWAFAHGANIGQLGLSDPWVGRIGAWGPIAASIRLFGDSEWALVLHSIAASLASVVLAGVIGYRLFSPAVAVIAARLFAILPIDVMYGTAAFGDEVAGFWCVATLAAFIETLKSGQLRWGAATGLAWGAAYLTKETSVLMALPFVLIWWHAGAGRVGPLLALAAGVSLVFAFELLFWQAETGDALYRWHATLAARSAFIPLPAAESGSWFGWIPAPIPTEILRSQNSVADAILMFLTNEEWGLLFYFVPFALLWTIRKHSQPAAWLSIFVVGMALLLAFFPLHFPRYTLGRDPRHFTQLGIPAVVLLAAWLHEAGRPVRLVSLLLLVVAWVPCLYVADISANVSVQREFAAYLRDQSRERIWMDSVTAADAIVLSGFVPDLAIGIVPPIADLQHLAPGARPSGAVHALRPDLPIAQSPQDLDGALVAMPAGRIPVGGWATVAEFKPVDGWLPLAVRRVLMSVGLPQEIVRKVGASHGNSIRIYRAPAELAALN